MRTIYKDLDNYKKEKSLLEIVVKWMFYIHTEKWGSWKEINNIYKARKIKKDGGIKNTKEESWFKE